MTLPDFISQTVQTDSPDLLFRALVSEAQALGFEYVAYGRFDPGAMPRHAAVRRYPAVMLNYPRAWQQHYFAQGYQHVDPVVLRAKATAQPYLWSDLQSDPALLPGQRQLFAAARDFGLTDGLSIPLHGVGGRCGVLSFASSHRPAIRRHELATLRVLAMQFDLCFDELQRGMPVQPDGALLSARECDCLNWAARGKSAWDIGRILGISEHTVRFHLKNALQKLRTQNRVAAIVKAMHYGLIDPLGPL